MKNVLKKLIAIQSELKCRKDKKATNYKYRSAEDILENLKPILANANCTIVISDDVEVIGDESYYKSTITLYDCDSEEMIENHSYVKEGEAKFMSVGQYSGATISYCRKYALCGLFSIDDGEDLDSVEDKKTEKKVEKKEEKSDPKQQTTMERLQEAWKEGINLAYSNFMELVEKIDRQNVKDYDDIEWVLERGRKLIKNNLTPEGMKKEVTEICLGLKSLIEWFDKQWQ